VGVAETNEAKGGRGDESDKPLPPRKTTTPCLCPLCRMSTKSLKCVGPAPITRGVVSIKSWSPRPPGPITLSFLTSKPFILRRLCLLVRLRAWPWFEGVPMIALTEARPASEMAPKMLLKEPELSSWLFLADSEKSYWILIIMCGFQHKTTVFCL
jgi:hypothetical protein